MQEPILSPRLAAAAGMVRKGGEICDVGTDHALLPCRLYLDGERKLTAADINEGPLLSAKQTEKKMLCVLCCRTDLKK